MNKLIVVFGGSFNPITNAHLALAEQLTNEYSIEKILFLPVSDLYRKKDLVSAEHRVNMLNEVFKTNPNFEVCDIDVKSPVLLRTIDSLSIIKNRYKDYKVIFLMGTDNLKKITHWYRFRDLISNFYFIIIERNGDKMEEIISRNSVMTKYKEHFLKADKVLRNDGSSTHIRNLLKEGKSIRYLVPNEVYDYIVKNKLYINKEDDIYE